jgi:hypothetical protein
LFLPYVRFVSFIWAAQVDLSGLARRRDGCGDVLRKNIFSFFSMSGRARLAPVFLLLFNFF